MWFDSHAHLPMLTHDSVETILERATAAKVTQMVTVATEAENWKSSAECAERYPGVYYSVGAHPHEAGRWAECREQMRAALVNRNPKKCVAIGEIGLDYYYKHASPEHQHQSLEEQLQLAREFDLPVIFHCREAFADLFRIVKKVGLSQGAVLHCFTGEKPDATQAVDLGFKISFSGILTFKTAEGLRDTAKHLPSDAILLETDCPYLAPMPMRGKPNEPSYLTHTAHCLAEVRGESVERVAEYTTRNAESFFRIS